MDGNRFHWRAVYSDGTELKQVEDPITDEERAQFDELSPEAREAHPLRTEKKNAYADINLKKLARFEMWDWRENKRVLHMDFQPGQKLIWRRRTFLKGGIAEVIHIIGKKQKQGNKTIQAIMVLFESDGRVEVLDNFREDHPFFSKPKLHPHEDF